MSASDLQDFLSDKPNSQGEFSLRELLKKDIQLIPSRFTEKNKEAFYLELSTLLTAGLDIKSALELLEEEQEKKFNKDIIKGLKDNLINGDSLWEAMQKSTVFTPYEYFSIQIGEETGKTSLVLDQLYQFYQSRLKQRRQLVSALSYPVIILCTSVGAVAFMLLFIVPMFSDVFKRFGGDLPYLTKVIISLSGGIRDNFIWVMMVLAIGGFVFYRNRNSIAVQKVYTKLLGRIPVIGKIVYSIQLARFSTSMALLLGSKVPIVRSINLIGQMITFYPISQTLPTIANDLMNGQSLHESMSRFPVYSRKMVSLIKVGEEVNKLDVFFERLGKQFAGEVDHQTGLLNTFLEPVMIIFLGAMVGFILMAMYLPMFQMSTSIGG